jgi:protein-disulfide isomerase
MRSRLFFLFAALPALAFAAPETDPRLGAPFEKRARPSLGSDQAPIVVVEFGSYKCGHCEAFHQNAFPALKKSYVDSGKVQWFMVPTSDNPADQSGQIFLMGRCVERQGKFWDQLQFLMTISSRPPSFLNDLVRKNSAIDSEELTFCLQQRDTRVLVAKDFEEYHALKVIGTPTFVIRKLRADGTRAETTVRGYHPAEYFQQIFDELAKTP